MVFEKKNGAPPNGITRTGTKNTSTLVAINPTLKDSDDAGAVSSITMRE
jgi:hypothetical protein